MPGGCNFGVRPIDQHLKGLEALGAQATINDDVIHVKADRLIGAHVYFDIVSVGATINVMLAAVKAQGVTILENVAKEPHIVDLANFLNSCLLYTSPKSTQRGPSRRPADNKRIRGPVYG